MLTELNAELARTGEKKYKLAQKFGLHHTRLSQIINGMYKATDREKSLIANGLGKEIKELFPDSRSLIGAA